MTAKKKTPAKPRIVKDRQLPLVLDAKAQKLLENAHILTGEKTATKAIIQCMQLAVEYKNLNRILTQEVDSLRDEMQNSKEAIAGYLLSFDELKKVFSGKPVTKKKCQYCNNPLVNGKCPDCD